MSLQGKNAIVTGASRGIGKAIAIALLREGANVALAARNETALRDVAGSAKGQPGTALVTPADLTDPDQVRSLVETSRREFGQVHFLINSAGIIDNAPIAGHAEDVWRRSFAVNIDSYFYTTREVIGEMMERHYGRIVNIASNAAKLPRGPNRAAYVASKAAVIGFTREVAMEAANYGVTVNAICPGFVMTEMLEESVRKFAQDLKKTEEEVRQDMIQRIPMRRFLAPEEVAALALFLLSDAAAAITAQAISIDGGAAPV